jgi:hypothetical protein
MSRSDGSSGRRSVGSNGSGRIALVAVAAVFIIAGIVGGIAWSRASAQLERADLEADPAFALRLSQADELARVGADRTITLEGEQPPFAGHIYGTSGTSAEVYAFYEVELARLGWRPQRPPYPRSTAELESRLYCKSRVEFRLAIKDKETAFRPEFYQGHVYTTVFDARLRAIDPNASCPLPAPSARP